MNIQPIEKLLLNPLDLEVHSIFETIQGEGPFCGTPCVFIRLTGCNLQCPGCDTEYTSSRVLLSANSIIDEVQKLRQTGLVVITGGEPFRQPVALANLLHKLVDCGYYVQIETNGVLPLPDGETFHVAYNTHPADKHGVYVVVSPKTDRIHVSVEDVACAFKYVLSASSMDEDGLPIKVLDHNLKFRVARPRIDRDVPIYVQPMDAQQPFTSQMNLNAAVDSCLKHGYIIQLQIHKLIGVA